MKKALGFALAMAGLLAISGIFAAFGQDSAKLYVYSGTLRSVDLKARTIIVEGSSISQKFVVPTDAEIIVKDKPRGDLSDLMIGDGIQVKYTEDDNAFVAHQISLLGLKAP